MATIVFSILITTKDRRDDLAFTLGKISDLLKRDDVECIICDDGSSDGTSGYLSKNFPQIKLFSHPVSKGLIYSRNRLFEKAQGDYVISIDDDLNFLSENPLDAIRDYFGSHPDCGVISFRIFWSKQEPGSHATDEVAGRVKNFAGGANAWRMSAWKSVRDYPDWFVFYGEEDFASFELFRKKWEVHYVPEVLVHHRVELKLRKKDKDYLLRQRRALRAGWYLYFLFLPLRTIPRKMAYSIWMQFSGKIVKGNFVAFQALLLAAFDVIAAAPKLIRQSNRLSRAEYKEYMKIADLRLYWKPKS
jgi:glycosyltransferase involved in cell wall biosynthesis